jgi:hypothetical protein
LNFTLAAQQKRISLCKLKSVAFQCAARLSKSTRRPYELNGEYFLTAMQVAQGEFHSSKKPDDERIENPKVQKANSAETPTREIIPSIASRNSFLKRKQHIYNRTIVSEACVFIRDQ